MKILLGEPQTGKTSLMIEWLQKDKNHVLIVINQRRADDLTRQFSLNGDQSRRIVTWNDLKSGRLTATAISGKLVLGIDDIDLVVQQMTSFPIEFATATILPNDL